MKPYRIDMVADQWFQKIVQSVELPERDTPSADRLFKTKADCRRPHSCALNAISHKTIRHQFRIMDEADFLYVKMRWC